MSDTVQEEQNAFDLAMWLINFEFQDPRNRHMTYKELARIYATKIEDYTTAALQTAYRELLDLMPKTETKFIGTVDLTSQYTKGHNAALNAVRAIIESKIGEK